MQERSFEHELVLEQVLNIRSNHPRMGGRKLYELLEPFMLEHQIKLGRDAVFDLLAANHLLVRRRKRRVQTTNSSHWLRRYPNLVRELIPSRSNQLWVSDITYWKIETGYLYLSLITDAYSRKIVGYQLAGTLEAAESVLALQMALATWPPAPGTLIHHSDRGVQYCSSAYVELLQEHGIAISMTENGDPLENAVAERVNGILKQEYLECYLVENLDQARKLLEQVVALYNQQRPHMSIGNRMPAELHESNQQREKLWKNYYTKNLTLVKQSQD